MATPTFLKVAKAIIHYIWIPIRLFLGYPELKVLGHNIPMTLAEV